MQRNSEGQLQPIEYYIRFLTASSLTRAPLKWSLAILVCVKSILLVYRAFTIYTDHRALASLMTTRDLIRRIVRWLMKLGENCFIVVYRKRKLNVVPDVLSRLPQLTFPFLL